MSGHGFHGATLIDRVIAACKSGGLDLIGRGGLSGKHMPRPLPAPELERLSFPGGKPVPESIRRWLAFDASWLGWFEDLQRPVFQPMPLAALARREFGVSWGYDELGAAILPGDCLPLNSDGPSRYFLYLGAADSVGEYPVMVLDVDDLPCIGIEYPGFDVYLADFAGLLDFEGDDYTALPQDPVYGPRVREHADRYFCGLDAFELGVEAYVDDAGQLIRRDCYQR